MRCGRTWCPDCDTEGATCECPPGGLHGDRDPVDDPPRRKRPRRLKLRQRGAVPVEYTMLVGFVVLIAVVLISVYTTTVDQILAPGDQLLFVSASTSP
jgi:Flp pilus assembly pilin Flp